MNRDAILNMLQMQHRMNSRVHEDWINQGFEWYRAAWIECGDGLVSNQKGSFRCKSARTMNACKFAARQGFRIAV